MRVLHVGKFFPPHPGGIELCTADLARTLTARGVDVAVVAHAEPGSKPSAFRDDAGFDVDLVACHGRLLYAPLSPTFPLQLRAAVREFKPDLLHLHVPNTSAFSALAIGAARRLPWVVHWHADIPPDSQRRLLRAAYAAYRPVERALLRRAAAIVATSAPYRDTSTALAPWRAKTAVIPLGIDFDDDAGNAAQTRDALWPSGKLRLLCVGRLSYFKGLDVLLRAIAPLPQIALAIVGDGECRGELEALSRSLGLDTRVKFVGRIAMDAAGRARLAAIYRSADAFCLPSTERAESFGLVLLEAMRAALPVVASAIAGSGVGYVVQDGVTGLLVPPGDDAALTSALRRLAADEDLRRALGAAGAARCRAEFTLDRQAERMIDLYRSILPARDSR